MALIAHYPLNGDLLDYSGNDLDLTGSPVYSDSGKIGKCLVNNNNYLSVSDEKIHKLFTSDNMSVCFWWYQGALDADWVDALSYHNWRIERGNGGSWGANNPSYYTPIHSPDGSRYLAGAVDSDIKFGDWMHFTVTRGNHKLKVYINGKIHKSLNYTGDVEKYPETIFKVSSQNVPSDKYNDIRLYNHTLSDKEIKEISKAKVLHYTCNDMQEPTVNTIPSGIKNSYPQVGNTWGTYNTTQYANNTEWSIGEIASVSDNIVTLSSVGKPIYDYDVLWATISGGGIKAKKDYFIKKHSTNSFSLHEYDSSQNGSKGFSVHDSVNNDIRVPITSGITNIWRASAHRPNMRIVKTIVPNALNGHEVMQINTSFVPQEANFGGSGVAFGVSPPATEGKTYSFSFKYKLVNDFSAGKISSQLWTHDPRGGSYTDWDGDNIDVSINDNDWHTFKYTGVSPGTGPVSFYIWQSKGMDIMVSEFQFEEQKFPSNYSEGIRDGIINDMSGHQNHATLELVNTPHWVKDSRLGTGGYEFYGSQKIKTKQLFFDDQNQNWTTCGWIYVNDRTTNNQNFINFNSWNKITHVAQERAIMYLGSTSGNEAYTYSNQIPNSQWFHIGFVCNSKTKRKDIYINGIKSMNGGASWEDSDILDGFKTETIFGEYFQGKMDDIRVYATDLSDSDMMELYQSRANLDDNGNLCINVINEQKNIFDKQNNAIKDKQLKDGLGSYTQQNCQVSFTNEGYRIYRPADLVRPGAGNTMWGGMRVNDGDDNNSSFKVGRKYKLTYEYKGKSSNTLDSPYFAYSIGWTTMGGLRKISPTSKYIQPSNFEGDWTQAWAIFEPQQIFFTSTIAQGGTIVGDNYNCMRQLKIGYGYLSTGTLGTDITIRNIKMVDITDDPGTFNNKSLLEVNGLNEVGVIDGMIGYWKFKGAKTDFSSTDSVDPSFHYDSVLTSDGVKFVNTENSYIIYKKIHEQMMVKGKEDEESYSISLMVKPSGVTQQNEAMVFAKPGNHTGLTIQNNKWNWRFAMTTGVRYVFSSEIISPNEWAHISCTYNRREAKIYVNGVLNNTVTIDGSYNWSADYFKSGYSGANFKFDGKIKEVKVFNRALSHAEVKIEYNRLMTDEKFAIREDGSIYARNFKEGY